MDDAVFQWLVIGLLCVQLIYLFVITRSLFRIMNFLNVSMLKLAEGLDRLQAHVESLEEV